MGAPAQLLIEGSANNPQVEVAGWCFQDPRDAEVGNPSTESGFRARRHALVTTLRWSLALEYPSSR